MKALLQLFFDIALWRRGPRHVPASGALLAAVALAYTVVSVLQSFVVYGAEQALLRGIADLVLTLAVFWVALAVARRTHRYRQTATAVLGTGALLALPMLALQILGTQVGDASPVAFLVALAALPLVVWYLFVVGHIMREALEAPLFTGMAVALTYFVLSYALLVQLLPPATGA